MLRIQYREADLAAVISWDQEDDGKPWPSMVRRLAMERAISIAGEVAVHLGDEPLPRGEGLRDPSRKVLHGRGAVSNETAVDST